jgi:ribonuclease III, bacterial
MTREDLEQRIGYTFQNAKLLEQSMQHRSYVNEKKLAKAASNERLEFLGDAVLELVSSEFLFWEDEEMLEGNLTKLRASIVCEPSLARCARELELGKFLKLGKGEDNNGGRERDSLLSDALESVIGAIYLDSGYASAQKFVKNVILQDIEKKQLFYDSKTILQELIQEDKQNMLYYRLVKETGPDHEKVFVSEVYVNEVCYGSGNGSSKKLAEQNAAYQAILKLRNEKA